MMHRVENSRRRAASRSRTTETPEWMMQRRERTRHLIELGGLVQKAGLVDLTDDDRAVLFGVFLVVAAQLQGEKRVEALTLWRRRGKRAFEAQSRAESI
jgi:hypothetical protein